MFKSRMKMSMILSLLAALFLVLGACSTNEANTESTDSKDSKETTEGAATMKDTDDNNMDKSDSGEVPEGLKVAENPTYEVGSHAYIKADHMEGMQGAKATIVGAYDTTAYAISYTPTTGGEKVENHKWVIHEELQDAGEPPLELGTEVTVNAAHMAGMAGATAKIVSAEETTVYMIDFTPTTGGEEVKNHGNRK